MQQPGSMMDRPLLVSAILEHGENQYGDQQIASRDTDGRLHRYRFADMAQRARQLGKKTPCAVKADRCYDCRSPERVCRALVTLWGPMLGMETEVLLVDEDLGL